MSTWLAVLMAVAIAVCTLIFIVCYICDVEIIDAVFAKLSKKAQYAICFVAVVALLVYLGANFIRL